MLKITYLNFFVIPFSNIIKSILTNCKKAWSNVLRIAFSNTKKSTLTNLQRKLAQFFAYHLFQILKKSMLPKLKKSLPNFLLITFFKN